ncbi:hypothetical protein NDU88_000958 [Pleurodeles waltl]|uniref:Uncharacterized protein n=1 Tax=Pleurodeles waltl TaxID=8319 RepID=A0AAV7R7L3_PLEWA|nr:hypothetical protein NDU88_000958 [Pleurodeles waltl]
MGDAVTLTGDWWGAVAGLPTARGLSRMQELSQGSWGTSLEVRAAALCLGGLSHTGPRAQGRRDPRAPSEPQ